MTIRAHALLATAAAAVALTACGAGGKTYDISPIFPLTADKCATYGGEQEGEGFNATCMVSKEECERAAADWRESMESSGVQDAIMFRCD